MMNYKKIELQDLDSISQDQYRESLQRIQEIQSLLDSREQTVRTLGLDPEIALPQGNWKDPTINNIHTVIQQVMSADFKRINELRQDCYNFSGYFLKDVFDTQQHILDPLDLKLYLKKRDLLPPELTIQPPRMLGEIGWNIDGIPVNPDTIINQGRIFLLYKSGVYQWLQNRFKEKRTLNILEIGGGYGGFAYHLKQLFPEANYFLIDIPECLLFAYLYLPLTQSGHPHELYNRKETCPGFPSNSGFNYLPNYFIQDLVQQNIDIDLAINTWSFAEMISPQVDYYGRILKSLVKEEGILFEQNVQPKQTVKNAFCLPKEVLEKHFSFRSTLTDNLCPSDRWFNNHCPLEVWGNFDIEHCIIKKLGHEGLKVHEPFPYNILSGITHNIRPLLNPFLSEKFIQIGKALLTTLGIRPGSSLYTNIKRFREFLMRSVLD